MRRLRRIILLGLLGGGGFVAFTKWKQQRSSAARPVGPPEWPPIAPKTPGTTGPKPTSTAPIVTSFRPITDSVPSAAAAHDHDHDHEDEPVRATWLAPVDGACPEGYPIKANDNSGIFHVPGGRFYARTVPERCYADADDAIRDGYRPAKA